MIKMERKKKKLLLFISLLVRAGSPARARRTQSLA